jgi:hypothetical protein
MSFLRKGFKISENLKKILAGVLTNWFLLPLNKLLAYFPKKCYFLEQENEKK